MGLDLRVVTNLKFIGKEEDYSDDVIDDMYDNSIHLFKNDMGFNQSDDLVTGFYKGDYPDSVEHISWSYGGYNQWRNHLIDFIGYGDIHKLEIEMKSINRDVKIGEVIDEGNTKINIPFVEMCYYSDCEGVIGARTSSKLYKDFVNNKEKYLNFTKEKMSKQSDNSYYTNYYNNLTEYFKIASENNGAVIFR